jgi:hypothetical protein
MQIDNHPEWQKDSLLLNLSFCRKSAHPNKTKK